MDLYSILRLANVMDIETFLEALAGITTCHWVMSQEVILEIIPQTQPRGRAGEGVDTC